MSYSGQFFNLDEDEQRRQRNVQLCQQAIEIFKKEFLDDDEDEGESSTRKYVLRNREEAEARLKRDYFDDNPIWGEAVFRRRFRMSKRLFLRIANTLAAREPYFQQYSDATGRLGFHTWVKCTVALRQLANGGSSDQYDEYLHVGPTSDTECLKNFCRAIRFAFGDHYLRRPNADDVARLTEMHERKHDFPGMLGSIDCMHWEWKNCPTSWRGMYTTGRKTHPTLILEAVASQDLWIWHAFFGCAGFNNDVNVLNQSTVFNDVLNGRAPLVTFKANGREYNMGYYLADGIYPKWATFVKTVRAPSEPKRCRFAKIQEAARKDVEMAFGVLQARFAIVKGSARLWFREHLCDIMYACIILHNMIIEDERARVTQFTAESSAQGDANVNTAQVLQGGTPAFREYMDRRARVQDKRAHNRLGDDLIEEIWTRFGPLH